MDKEEALEILDGLDGDEHVWVDLKEDYYIQGNPFEQAEFIKDVQALGNADTSREERLMFIGCDETSGVVGVDIDAFDVEQERRHILSFEEDDLQEKVDGSLEPPPRLSLHRYEEDGETFGVLVVRDVERVPSVSTSSIGDNGKTILRKGDIWLRKASGKKLAENDDIERMVERRIDSEREFILEGIRRVVELDPETIADIGSIRPSETAEADITFDIAPEGDYSVSGNVFQREFSDLEEELNADIGKHRRSPDYYVTLHSLMRYYSEVDPPSDNEAIEVLFESSLRRWLPGIYWLSELDSDEALDQLRNVSDQHAVRTTACKVLVIAGDDETFDSFLTESDSITYARFDRGKYRGLMEESVNQRIDELSSNTTIEVEDDLDKNELKSKAGELANRWLSTDKSTDKQKLKYALVNVELELARHVFSL